MNVYQQLIIIFSLLSFAFIQNDQPQLISFDFSSKNIENKKIITTEGEVYFNKKNFQMVTHLKKPFESVIFVNADGEVKVYDFESNTVVQFASSLASSESSYFWYFFTGQYHDFGLAKNGYSIKETKIEEGVLVNTWAPLIGKEKYATNQKVIIASEKNLPIYIEFFKDKNTSAGKIYFSEYQKIHGYSIPLKIVEIYYKTKKDSIVTIKKYFNPKIGKDVTTKYIDFKIPGNAKKFTKK